MSKTSSSSETMFTVIAPPGLGYYKLVINAARVPRIKAKVIMPVVATFLVKISNFSEIRNEDFIILG